MAMCCINFTHSNVERQNYYNPYTILLWVDGAEHDDFTWVADEQHRKTLAAFQQLIKKQNMN